MKTPKSTTVNPVIAPKAEQKAAPKKTSAAQPSEKKPHTVTKVEPPIASTPQKPTAPKKVKAASPVAATPDLSMPERIGLTAGSIWQYLSENGTTPVTNLVAALTEEEKIIQRSIGWLAQEDKITINTIDRIEIIALKG